MTTAELEAIKRRHKLETADGNCAGSYSWDPEGWYRPQGHDLDLAVEDIGKLLAELEREVTHSEALGDEIGDLQEALAAELAWHEPCQDGRRTQPVCRICSEINRRPSDRWACAAGRRLAAVLGEAAHG